MYYHDKPTKCGTYATKQLFDFQPHDTENKVSDVAIDLAAELIDFCIKTLFDCYIAKVGNFVLVIL